MENNCCTSLQLTNLYSLCCETSPTPASSHFVHNHTIFFPLVLNTMNLYPFWSPHTCQCHKSLWKVVIELQHSQLSVLQDKEAYHDWFSFFFVFRFGKLYLAKLIVDMPQPLEHFIVDQCMCLFVIRVPCNWMVTAIRNLISIRAVCKQLHSFCNNIIVGILVSLTTKIDIGLPKFVKIFHRGVLNESINFCSCESKLQVK